MPSRGKIATSKALFALDRAQNERPIWRPVPSSKIGRRLCILNPRSRSFPSPGNGGRSSMPMGSSRVNEPKKGTVRHAARRRSSTFLKTENGSADEDLHNKSDQRQTCLNISRCSIIRSGSSAQHRMLSPVQLRELQQCKGPKCSYRKAQGTINFNDKAVFD